MGITKYFNNIFRLDYRALAFLRVSVGVLVLVDLIRRASDFSAHYTNQGIFGELQLQLAESLYIPSVYLLSGAFWWQAGLFLFTGLLAILLIVGYRTKVVAFLLWYLVLSLQLANPYITNRGDLELLFLLFWGMFLPWDRLFSVDYADTKGPTGSSVLSAATIAYVLQIGYIYYFAFIHKCQSSVWCGDFTAVHYAFSMDSYSTSLADYLIGHPTLLSTGTIFIILVQLLVLPLLLTKTYKDRARIFIVSVLILTHIAYIFTLHIGLFAYISLVGLIALYPPRVWDWLEQKLFPHNDLIIYYDKDCNFCYRSVVLIRAFFLNKRTKIVPAQSDTEIYKAMQKHNSWVIQNQSGELVYTFAAGVEIAKSSPLLWFLVPFAKLPGVTKIGEYSYRLIANHRNQLPLPQDKKTKWLQNFSRRQVQFVSAVIIVISFLSITIGNFTVLSYVTLHPNYEKLLANLRFDQDWGVFAPIPNQFDGWYIAAASTTQNIDINLLDNGRTLSFERPEDISDAYINQRWRAFLSNLYFSQYKELQEPYLLWLCQNSNVTSLDIKKVDLIYALEFTTPTSSLPVKFQTLESVNCP